MWFFSVEAWSLFFRVGYLIFVGFLTLAGFLFVAHLLIESFWRLVTKVYGLAAVMDAMRAARNESGPGKWARRFRTWCDKHPL